mmetsp:Transcript_39222/g.103380  ORF Transcript_39222/g.103380 Transcript_39222/m.103380 type:complete len:106 (+) Transcript_39222:399-716(+)
MTPSPSLPARPLLARQGALVNKWNAARAEAQLEDQLHAAAEAPPSLGEIERAKRQRLAAWKQALPAEEAERNTNFAPVAGDWRARVARVRERKATGLASGDDGGA